MFTFIQVRDPGLLAGKAEDFNRPDEKLSGRSIHTLSISWA
jgi:hypothetical protein